MLLTNTYGSWSWAIRVAMAWLNWARKVSVGVMVDGEEVHRSLAPQQDGHIAGALADGLAAWGGAAAILAPETASL